MTDRSDGYEHIGKVHRALAAHDSRLAEQDLAATLQDRLTVARVKKKDRHDSDSTSVDGKDQLEFDFESLRSENIHAIIASASGFKDTGGRIVDSIITEVRRAGRSWYRDGADLAAAVGHSNPKMSAKNAWPAKRRLC